MTQINIIVAVDAAGGIGINNSMPWHLPEDMARFKQLTTGNPVIMGRKTFDSIGRVLPNRRNIVITRNSQWARDGVETASSLEAAVALAGDAQAYIIGGAEVYSQAMAIADQLIVTEIAETFQCDAFFHKPDPAIWHETAREPHVSALADLHYAFVTWQRIDATAGA